ncbi:MAG TPA: HNH endonuclease [Bacteroidales bacterium]|nr:HNH endonuclease [Bacteroidales bacterium]
MALVVFSEKDDPYLKWMDDNPSGYVINTNRNRNTTYVTLHRSGCFTIRDYINGQQKGGYTARNYIKICSNDAQELFEWAQKNRPKVKGFNSYCKKCNPNPDIYYSIYPDQIPEDETYIEGAKQTIKVNSYERSIQARRKCLDYWGLTCSVCGMKFEERYGELGKGFIHVHHIRELSKITKDYKVDPIKDLRPVCPNCHAMLHKKNPALEINELKKLINQ